MSNKTPIDIKPTLLLMKRIKQGVKQQCQISIFIRDNDLQVELYAKNYKMKKPMIFQLMLTEELIMLQDEIHEYTIDKFIEDANYYFEKQQSVE